VDFYSIFALSLAFLAILTTMKGLRIVPQQSAWVVEKLGRYDRTLQPGLNFLIPFVESVPYKHSLKEYAAEVQEQTAITRDNVTLVLDGIIYLKIIDPVHASYGVSNPFYAVTQLAQTTMRSEIGRLTMDATFEERDQLNANIVTAINAAAQTWGIQCMRYEIRNITPPTSVLKAMEMQVSAERQKRAVILESEGKRQSQINVAEGGKQEVVLRSEGSQIDQINRAKGEAEALLAVATATAASIEKIASAINAPGGREAVELKIAEQYVRAFANLAKTSTTLLLPGNPGDPGAMVAQALSVFDTVRKARAANETGPRQA
jgi:regulator of protease activity HflC (stomatin/prohibitin superfamily)